MTKHSCEACSHRTSHPFFPDKTKKTTFLGFLETRTSYGSIVAEPQEQNLCIVLYKSLCQKFHTKKISNSYHR